MIFWDSSALVTLIIPQGYSSQAGSWYEKDRDLLAWWGTVIECCSAIARLQRTGEIDEEEGNRANILLNEVARSWRIVDPSSRVRDTALRMLRVHPLSAADSLQLAAVVIANAEMKVSFVCFDRRLSSAAQKEGIYVYPFQLGTAQK